MSFASFDRSPREAPWSLALRRPPSTDHLLAPAAARLATFLALAGFGALHWGRMAEPQAPGPVLVVVVAALPAALALLAARRLASARARAVVTAAVALALVVVALLAVGIPARLLGPRGWGELASGLLAGLGDLTSVRIPYRGLDAWTRATLVLGGGLLVAVSAVLAFVPRGRGDVAATDRPLGRPGAAAGALAVLFATPAVQLEGTRPWVAGAVFAALLAAFLLLERVRGDGARLALAGVGLAVLLALLVAPRIDRTSPLIDYEQLAQDLTQSSTSRFDWNHGYGPLDWPRDGREVLRIRSPRQAYWKAANLSRFDGLRWVRGPTATFPLDGLAGAEPDGRFRMQVSVRGLVSTDFVAAGTALGPPQPSTRISVPTGAGTYGTLRRPLRRGATYAVNVDVPRPRARRLAASGGPYPDLPGPYLSMGLPSSAPASAPPVVVAFAPWGTGEGPRTFGGGGARPADALDLLRASPYARTWALAQRLRRRADTPHEYVRAVQAHLADGFTYSEAPALSRVPLDTFLFRDKRGYCQHFSGAMALLLRMGGIPARVATGFSPGTRDEGRREFVVRDTDAHSWVEAWYPRVGWVTFDPTPGDSPAASQTSDRREDAVADEGDDGDAPGSERALGRPGVPGPGSVGALDEGSPTGLWAALGAAVLALAALVALAWRRRVRALAEPGAGVAELRRALARTGRPARASTTLEDLATRFRGTEGEAYLRALVAERYGHADRPPTPEERAALRRALGEGLGVGGRLRAWWALPPGAPRTQGPAA